MSQFKRQNPPLKDRLRVGAADVTPSSNFLFLPVKICLHNKTIELQALVDSGAEQSFIDQCLVSQLSLPTELLDPPVLAARLGGQHLSRITHRTQPILLITSGNHREYTQLYITHTSQTPIVLGFPWLQLHNPQLDWSQCRVTNWGFSVWLIVSSLRFLLKDHLKQTVERTLILLTCLPVITILRLSSARPRLVLYPLTDPTIALSTYYQGLHYPRVVCTT